MGDTTSFPLNNFFWIDLGDLPLGNETQQLLQQNWWIPIGPSHIRFVQNAIHQALIACALERFYLANGKYPVSLDKLVPATLPVIPNDMAHNRPMLYETTGDGRYILRSVGPDGKDDRKSRGTDDWIWFFGTNNPALKAK